MESFIGYDKYIYLDIVVKLIFTLTSFFFHLVVNVFWISRLQKLLERYQTSSDYSNHGIGLKPYVPTTAMLTSVKDWCKKKELHVNRIKSIEIDKSPNLEAKHMMIEILKEYNSFESQKESIMKNLKTVRNKNFGANVKMVFNGSQF